jgi:hypothetical protein
MKETSRGCSLWLLYGGRHTKCTPFSWAQCHLAIVGTKTVTIQCQNKGNFFRQLHKTEKMFEPLHQALFLDPSSLVTSCYWTWRSAVQEFSLQVAPREHLKSRNICNGGIHAGNNCHKWTPLCWRQTDQSLNLKEDTFVYFMLNSLTRFVIVKWAMGREVNQPQHWIKYVEKVCVVYFCGTLYSCCRSNLGLE